MNYEIYCIKEFQACVKRCKGLTIKIKLYPLTWPTLIQLSLQWSINDFSDWQIPPKSFTHREIQGSFLKLELPDIN